MEELVTNWGHHNTHTSNLKGLFTQQKALEHAFEILNPTTTIIPTEDSSLGNVLVFKKREKAETQVLLMGHYDTVHPESKGFTTVEKLNETTLKGPGVTDMKAGIVILLKALEAFEKEPESKHIGWTVILTPDEEIGSPGSKDIFLDIAKDCHVGLVYEPTLPNGKVVSARVGSSNVLVTVTGTSAHAGRAFKSGRSAIHALADWITACRSKLQDEIIFNVGTIDGGTGTNTVAPHAECTVNVRSNNNQILQDTLTLMQSEADALTEEGLSISVTVKTLRPPKPFDATTETLFHQLKACAHQLDQELDWEASGGVCDGNDIAALGIPTIDTLGANGSGIHTHNETLHLPSLVQKAQLSFVLLKSLNTPK
jgi:glutamate carboxypeptidase